MGSCCARNATLLPEHPFDHRVYIEQSLRRGKAKVWESTLQGGGQELMRFNRVRLLGSLACPDRADSCPPGVLVLTELFVWLYSAPTGWHGQEIDSSEHKPSKASRSGTGSCVLIGYSAIEEVGIVWFDTGGTAVRIVTRSHDTGEQFELIVCLTQGPDTLNEWTTTIPDDAGSDASDSWHQTLATVLDRALKSYHWAHNFLHCALRQRELFAHNGGDLPELVLLPNEEISESFSNILNFGASQEDLVGHLIVTNCRVVWALDRDRTTYNVSVPHRAHVPSLTDTATFGLCIVLYIQHSFMNNSDHVAAMRLGFGASNVDGNQKKERLEMILEHIKATQAKYIESPKYGVADYMRNRRQYQVEQHKQFLHALSHLDILSEGTKLEAMEMHLQGEVCECVICLDQVCNDGPLAYLLAAGKLGWACRHIFHLQCAEQLQTRKCPVCRTSFSEVRKMPDIRRSPGAWFDAMDVDRTGDLDIDEVLGALTVVLPVDRDKLEGLLRPEIKEGERTLASQTDSTESGLGQEAVADANSSDQLRASLPAPLQSELWRQWDKEGTGRITRQAFQDPEGGLLVWILARLKMLHRGQRPRPCLAAAASSEALGRWFDFWDWSQIGFLTSAQITRAVAHEFEGRLPNLQCLELVQGVWRVIVDATISKPMAPPSGLVSSDAIPDEEPGSPSHGAEGQEHLLTAHADPWHLREGICSRGDFLDGGLGSALRIRLLDATSERSAAGRHRKLSEDTHALFNFEEALAKAATGSGITEGRMWSL